MQKALDTNAYTRISPAFNLFKDVWQRTKVIQEFTDEEVTNEVNQYIQEASQHAERIDQDLDTYIDSLGLREDIEQLQKI